uniref:START domain-containing protein n=1 Tax=Ciona savignyi TaxID=51511 RepID=H2ZQ05_CIOSA
MDYTQVVKEIEKEVIKISKIKKWHQMPSRKGIDISWTQSPSFSGNCYKFSCVVNAPCEMVYGVLIPPSSAEERLAWDKSIEDYYPLISIDENTFIAVIKTPAILMGMISPREFVDLFHTKVVERDEHWVFAGSVACDEHKVTKNYIRAKTHPSGYAAIPIDRNTTRVDFYINIDVGGMLPRALVEANLPAQQVKYIENLTAEVYRRLNK